MHLLPTQTAAPVVATPTDELSRMLHTRRMNTRRALAAREQTQINQSAIECATAKHPQTPVSTQKANSCHLILHHRHQSTFHTLCTLHTDPQAPRQPRLDSAVSWQQQDDGARAFAPEELPWQRRRVRWWWVQPRLAWQRQARCRRKRTATRTRRRIQAALESMEKSVNETF
jgi:hypothetical protein